MQKKINLQNIGTIILAGGLGTRLGDITKLTPKCMVPVANQPFIHWVLQYCQQTGLENINLSLGYLAGQVKTFIKKEYNSKVGCIVEPELMGTGGAINYCKKQMNDFDAYYVMNGDTLLLADFVEMLEVLNTKNVDAVILGSKATGDRFGKMQVTSDSLLTSFDEKSSEDGLINGGIYLLRKEFVNDFPEKQNLSFEEDVIPFMLSQNKKIHIHEVGDAPFIDIGVPESLARGDEFVLNNIVRKLV